MLTNKAKRNEMTKQEQNLLRQFETDLESAINSYLNAKDNILKDGNDHCYIIKNVVRDSLYIPKMNQYKLQLLLEFLKLSTNTQPSIEGYIDFNIKGEDDEDYSVRTYFFKIYTSHYHINIEDIDINKQNHYDIELYHVEYFEGQKYRLY